MNARATETTNYILTCPTTNRAYPKPIKGRQAEKERKVVRSNESTSLFIDAQHHSPNREAGLNIERSLFIHQIGKHPTHVATSGATLQPVSTFPN